MRKQRSGIEIDQIMVSAICGVVGSAMVAGGLTPMRSALGVAGIGALVALVVTAAAIGGGRAIGLLTALTAAAAMDGYQIHANVTSNVERRDAVTMVLVYVALAVAARPLWDLIIRANRPRSSAR